MQKLEAKSISRVVVRGANWVGDAVMTVPALRELRRLLPNAHITLATRSWAQGLFADVNFLDDLLINDSRGASSIIKQVTSWRKRQFDLAVLFPNAFEAALISTLARVPSRVGYATDGRRSLLTHPLPLPEWRSSKHEIFYYLNIIGELERLLKLERTRTNFPDASLQVSEERQLQARAFLREQGVRGDGFVIALCPGSINSRAKRWPAERFAALADSLISEMKAEILLVGSPDEVAVSVEVSRQMRLQPIMLAGKTDLAQITSVLSIVDLLVTNDTGLAHIAAALGRPTLVIFGPTNPLTTRPFSPVAEILRHPPDCAPCMLRDCPIDHRCMTAIEPREVFERAQVLLRKSSLAANSPHVSGGNANIGILNKMALNSAK